MFAVHPKMAKRWAAHTKDIKSLPDRVGENAYSSPWTDISWNRTWAPDEKPEVFRDHEVDETAGGPEDPEDRDDDPVRNSIDSWMEQTRLWDFFAAAKGAK